MNSRELKERAQGDSRGFKGAQEDSKGHIGDQGGSYGDQESSYRAQRGSKVVQEGSLNLKGSACRSDGMKKIQQKGAKRENFTNQRRRTRRRKDKT